MSESESDENLYSEEDEEEDEDDEGSATDEEYPDEDELETPDQVPGFVDEPRAQPSKLAPQMSLSDFLRRGSSTLPPVSSGNQYSLTGAQSLVLGLGSSSGYQAASSSSGLGASSLVPKPSSSGRTLPPPPSRYLTPQSSTLVPKPSSSGRTLPPPPLKYTTSQAPQSSTLVSKPSSSGRTIPPPPLKYTASGRPLPPPLMSKASNTPLVSKPSSSGRTLPPPPLKYTASQQSSQSSPSLPAEDVVIYFVIIQNKDDIESSDKLSLKINPITQTIEKIHDYFHQRLGTKNIAIRHPLSYVGRMEKSSPSSITELLKFPLWYVRVY